jgi:RNA polymerase sigma-70 factor (ECF subfamily)
MSIDTTYSDWYGPARGGACDAFDQIVLPHLKAGRRLARWLVRNPDDVDDVMQEASLRACRYFATFTGGDSKAWFLRIVRNTCAGWHTRRINPPTDEFDEECHSQLTPSATPETLLLQMDAAILIEEAMSQLSDRARQLLILREREGLSYREIANAMDIPIGTVMSGLARARDAFRAALVDERLSCLR